MVNRPPIAIILALAVALSLRVLVPAGWMPAQNQGLFAIEPCPSSGETMVMSGSSMEQRHGDWHKEQHNGDCSFSPLHAGFAQAWVSRPLLLARANASLPLTTFEAAIFARGPPALPPPSTGPPALA